MSVSREITKLFEETIRGTAASVLAHYTAHPPKGEIVIVVGGKAVEKSAKKAKRDELV